MDTPIVVEQSDLEELRLAQGTQNELLLHLAQLERQIKQLEAQIAKAKSESEMTHLKLEKFDGTIASLFTRVQAKYDIPQTARINLTTGAIE